MSPDDQSRAKQWAATAKSLVNATRSSPMAGFIGITIAWVVFLVCVSRADDLSVTRAVLFGVAASALFIITVSCCWLAWRHPEKLMHNPEIELLRDFFGERMRPLRDVDVIDIDPASEQATVEIACYRGSPAAVQQAYDAFLQDLAKDHLDKIMRGIQSVDYLDVDDSDDDVDNENDEADATGEEE